MKPVLDKDFDQLFKTSLEDFEVTPTANSWNKIAEQLESKPAKKKFPAYWMAAASVIFILGIGISLYLTSTEVIQLKPDQNKKDLAKKVAQPQTDDATDISSMLDNTVTAQEISKKEAQTTRQLLADNQLELATENTALADKNQVFKSNSKEEPVIEQLSTNPIKTKTISIQKMAINPPVEINSLSSVPVSAQNNIEKGLNEANIEAGGKLKIKSFGDVVNFVVSKVDKREDKIITISKTEDSDNEVTGINLGLISFKKYY